MLSMTIVGYIGQDATVRDTQNGNDVAISFSVAHGEKYNDAQGVQRERTTWVTATIFKERGRDAIAAYLKKGQLVALSGEPSVRAYLDKSNKEKAELRLRVKEIQLLGGNVAQQQPKPQQQPAYGQQSTYTPPSEPKSIMNDDGSDDLPF